jgi:hypothetical protein
MYIGICVCVCVCVCMRVYIHTYILHTYIHIYTNMHSSEPSFVVLSCHDSEWQYDRLADLLDAYLPGGKISTGSLMLKAKVGFVGKLFYICMLGNFLSGDFSSLCMKSSYYWHMDAQR